jgi:hypothetical protein
MLITLLNFLIAIIS